MQRDQPTRVDNLQLVCHTMTQKQVKDFLNLWYLPPGNGLASGKDQLTGVPSNYLQQMSENMIIPSRCIRLMDCVGQGEVYVHVWSASFLFVIVSLINKTRTLR